MNDEAARLSRPANRIVASTDYRLGVTARPELRIVIPLEGKGRCEIVADSQEDERRLIDWLRAALRHREPFGEALAWFLDDYERRHAA